MARLEWRPSPTLVAILLVIGTLAAGSTLASALPRFLAWPLAAMALGHGGWLAWRESRKPRQQVVLAADGNVEVDGTKGVAFVVQWRGVLAFASWRDSAGRRQRCVWWPDTLPSASRRELRLAAPVETVPRSPGSMAT